MKKWHVFVMSVLNNNEYGYSMIVSIIFIIDTWREMEENT